MTDILPTDKELIVLRLLAVSGAMYGYEICRRSDGKIRTTSVYKMAASLIRKDLLSVSHPRHYSHSGMARPLYRLTARGHRVVKALEELR